MKRRRVLVAGATGYLGRFLVKAFSARGWNVRVLVRNSSRLEEPGPALSPRIADVVDEVVIGDVTEPETIRGAAADCDVVFSTISLMGAKSSVTWHEVDYLGNLALLREAVSSGAQKFGYVSVFNADQLLHVPMVEAHEQFADELSRERIEHVVVRPTGYFSDVGAFLSMAQSGRVWMIGNGDTRINPIHGADLAEFCVTATAEHSGVVEVGGPETLTQREIGKAAFQAIGTPARISRIPIALARVALSLYGLFDRRGRDLAKFFVESAARDFVAPPFGTRRLSDHFDALVELA